MATPGINGGGQQHRTIGEVTLNTIYSGATSAPATPTIAIRVLTTPTRLEAEAKRVANVLRRLAHADHRKAASLWGPDRRGLTAALFDGNETLLTPDVLLIRNAAGYATGFEVDGHATDYATPNRVQADSGAPVLFAGSNANIARAGSRTSAEERLVRALREGPMAGVLAEKWAPDTNNPDKLPMRLASAIANGIVAESIRNAVGPERAGALNLARSFGTTVRQRLIRHLLCADKTADFKRDLFLEAPPLALAPHAVAATPHASPKLLMRDALGLPPAAMKILPRAVSPIAAYLLNDDDNDDDADPKTLKWLTSELCTALPDTANEQLRVLKFATGLLLAHLPADAVAERATWAARNYAPLFKDGIPPLRDWLVSDDQLLKRVAVPTWHGTMSPEDALEAAGALRKALLIAADPVRGAPFKLPRWASRQPIEHSTYFFAPAADEVDLTALGRRGHNCAGAYAPKCRLGLSVIGELIRTTDRKPTIGAVAEFALIHGKWRLAQIYGPANREPATAAVRAARTLLDVANGGAQ